MYDDEKKTTLKIGFAGIFAIAIILFLFFALFGIFGSIGAGERGVKTRFGAPTGEILGEGLYVKMPYFEGVKKVNIKIQSATTDANAASKDLQTVNTKVTLNFLLNPDKVLILYREIGLEYKTTIIEPMIQEAVKASTAKYTAEELITKRSEVRDLIKTDLTGRLNKYGIKLTEFNIVNFSFSESFDKAIEEKVTAEQNAFAARNKLKQIEFEAQQKVASAKGEAESVQVQAIAKAEAIRIESEALQNNPQLLELRAIEKWNGVLPQYTLGGNTVPFININK